MKFRKNLLAALLAGLFVFAGAACAGDDGADDLDVDAPADDGALDPTGDTLAPTGDPLAPTDGATTPAG